MSKKRRGDRKDGYYLRNMDPYHKILPIMMPRKCDALAFLNIGVDMTAVINFVKEKSSSDSNITIFSTVIAALIRTWATRPAMNRFIANGKYYQKKFGDLAFVAKVDHSDTGGERLIKIKFDKNDTVSEIGHKIYGQVDKIRSNKNDEGDIITKLADKPIFLKRIIYRLMIFLNKHGWVPKSLSEYDPDFSSLFVANMGSIGLEAPLHHLNEWGTNSVFLSLGKMYDKVVNIGGEIVSRKYMDFAFTIDERIADGYYYSKTFDVLKDNLMNPKMLEIPFYDEISDPAL